MSKSLFHFECHSGAAALLAAIMCAGVAAAQTIYHVAPSGSNEAPGTAEEPFQTITHAMSVLRPGDTCVIRAGRYHETIRPTISGTKETPIAIQAAQGENVIVSGADKIAGWTQMEGGIWGAPVEGVVSQLFVDGQMQPEACWPNTPNDPMQRIWATAGEGTGPNAIVDAELPQVDLSGAMAHILPGRHWVSWTLPVDSRDTQAHTLSISPAWEQSDPYAVSPGTRYYLFGARALLDAPGEWWYDAENSRLLFMPPEGADPNTMAIHAKRREHGIDLRDLSYVNVSGLKVFAANITLENASNCTVTDCHVRYASHLREVSGWTKYNHTGIVISGNANALLHSSVQYSAGNGVTLLGAGNRMEDCLVRHVNYMATDCAAVWAEGELQLIRQCTLSDAARSVLIHRYLKRSVVTLNDMSRAGLMNGDLGITYCFNTDGEGTEISYNWVHDNLAAHVGVGIYIDNGSSNFTVHHNVSWGNTDSGIRLNTPAHNIGVFHNTVFGNGNSLNYWGPEDNKDWAGCRILNNIFAGEVNMGDGAISEDNWRAPRPGLVSPETQDFRLRPNSRCIDAGKPIDGLPLQFIGAAPDIGAYEYNAPPFTPGHTFGEAPVF